MDKALLLENFTFHCGDRQIFSDVNLEVNRGEVVAICGTSAGNIRELASVLTRSKASHSSLSGTAFVDGADISRLTDEDMRFVRMMNLVVLPEATDVGSLRMSVERYISLPFKESIKKSNREIMLDAKRIMELLGVTSPERILQKKLSALSPKELRAVLYAAVLATDPALAIAYADAPDMTEAERDELYTLLIKICKIKNIALLLLTSDIAFARQFGESVYVSKYDRIIPFEGASHPYFQFLESAAKAMPLPTEHVGTEDILWASHVLPKRGETRLDFTLYKGEIISFPCKNGVELFSGKRKPVRGRVLANGEPLYKQKAFQKKVISISGKMAIPPAKNTDGVVSAFAVRPSLRQDTRRFYSTLPLPTGFENLPAKPDTLFAVLRLGLVCAAIAESKVILLSDIDKLSSKVDKYEILSLLSAVCAKTGACAIVFSDCDAVHRAVSSKLYKEETPEEALNTEPIEV